VCKEEGYVLFVDKDVVQSIRDFGFAGKYVPSFFGCATDRYEWIGLEGFDARSFESQRPAPIYGE
jgi:hypothetical protein